MKDYEITVAFDKESGCWMGWNDEIPLAFDADSIEDLMRKCSDAAPEILELNGLPAARSLRYV